MYIQKDLVKKKEIYSAHYFFMVCVCVNDKPVYSAVWNQCDFEIPRSKKINY